MSFGERLSHNVDIQERMIMLSKGLLFLFLFLEVLFCFGGRALAQPGLQQLVVTYVEFKPAEFIRSLRGLDHATGVLGFPELVDNPGYFVPANECVGGPTR